MAEPRIRLAERENSAPLQTECHRHLNELPRMGPGLLFEAGALGIRHASGGTLGTDFKLPPRDGQAAVTPQRGKLREEMLKLMRGGDLGRGRRFDGE